MRGLASWRVDKRWDTNGALTKRTLSVVVRQCKGSVQGVRTDPRCRTLRGVGSFGNGASQEPNSWNITISLYQKKSSRSPRGLSASTLRVASFMLTSTFHVATRRTTRGGGMAAGLETPPPAGKKGGEAEHG